MNHAKSIYCAGLSLLLTVTSNGCLEPTGSTTPKTTVQTRKTIGRTTQNILELEAARQAGGVPASMAITSSGIGVTADAYRTSVGTMAVLAVEQKMQMLNHCIRHKLNLLNTITNLKCQKNSSIRW